MNKKKESQNKNTKHTPSPDFFEKFFFILYFKFYQISTRIANCCVEECCCLRERCLEGETLLSFKIF